MPFKLIFCLFFWFRHCTDDIVLLFPCYRENKLWIPIKNVKKVLEGRARSHTEKSNKRAGSSNWFYCFFSLFCFSWLIAWRTLNFCYKNSIDCYCVVSHILLNFQLLKNKQIQRILANLLENFHVLTHKTATKEYLETRK